MLESFDTRNAAQVRFEGIDSTLDCGGGGGDTKEELGSAATKDDMESGDSDTEGACADRLTTRQLTLWGYWRLRRKSGHTVYSLKYARRLRSTSLQGK